MQIWVEVGWNLSGAIEVAVDVGSSRSRSSDGVVKVVVVVVEVGWNLCGAIEVAVDVGSSRTRSSDGVVKVLVVTE